MAFQYFSADNGTNGAALPQYTVSQGNSDALNYWNSDPTGGSTVQYSNVSPYKGTLCVRAGNGTTEANLVRLDQGAAGTGRGYIKLTAAPADSFCVAMNWGNTWANFTGFGISATRQAFYVNYASSAGTGTRPGGGVEGNGSTAANTVPLNTWIRYEFSYTSTTFRGMMWWTDPASIGTPDYDTGALTHSVISAGTGEGGLFNGVCTIGSSGPYNAVASGEYIYLDQLVNAAQSSWINLGPAGGTGGTTEIDWDTLADSTVLAGQRVKRGSFSGSLNTWCIDTTSSFAATNYWQTQSSDVKIGTKASTLTYGASSAVIATLFEFPAAATYYTRGYYKATAALANDTGFMNYMTNGFTKSNQAGVKTNRAFFAAANRADLNTTDTGAGATWASASNAMPLNAWFRVETKVTPTTVQIKVWTTNPDSAGTPDYDSGVLTSSSVGTLDDFRFGAQSFTGSAWTHILSSGQTLKMDELAVSDTDWIGPSATGSFALTSSTTAGATATAASITDAAFSLTSALTAAVDLTVVSSGPPGSYPTGTYSHQRALVTDDPADPAKGGPAIMNTLATETEAISIDLIAARKLGTGSPFSNIAAALTALWARAETAITNAATALTNANTAQTTANTAQTTANNALSRANHTGTQTASTISNFDTQVRTNRLDQMAAPTSSVALGSQRITGLATPTAGTDAATKAYVDEVPSGTTAFDFNKLRTQFINGGKQPKAMSSPPTMSVSAANASATFSGTHYYANDARFRYYSAAMENIGTQNGFANAYRQDDAYYPSGGVYTVGHFLDVEFETDSNVVEFALRIQGNGDPGQIQYQLFIDGDYVASYQPINLSAVAGNFYRIKATFGAGFTTRRWRLRAQGVAFLGALIPTDRTIWKSSRYEGLRAVCMSDSFGYNYSADDGYSIWGFGSPYVRAMEMLGFNTFNNVQSGSGFLATASGAVDTFIDRINTEVVPLNPDVVTVAGSVNDTNGFSLGAIQTAVNAFFPAIRAALPNAAIYAIGGLIPYYTWDASMTAVEGYIQTAANANNCTFIKTSDWLNGTGRYSAVTGNGNRDNYGSSDSYHLTVAGYTYAGNRLAATIGENFMRRA